MKNKYILLLLIAFLSFPILNAQSNVVQSKRIVNVVNESNFKNDAFSFINSELEILPNSKFIKKNALIQYNKDESSVIELTTLGNDQISEEIEFVLNTKMKNYSSLTDTELIISQSLFREINNLEYM